jgi:hypothetical protein
MMTNTFNHSCKPQMLSLGATAYWSLFATEINSDREPVGGLS